MFPDDVLRVIAGIAISILMRWAFLAMWACVGVDEWDDESKP